MSLLSTSLSQFLHVMLIIQEPLQLSKKLLMFKSVFPDIHKILTNTEWINTVPALGTKFSTFIDYCMKVAQHEQYCLEFSLLATHFQCLLVEVVKGLV